jgi:hypothetical protein
MANHLPFEHDVAIIDGKPEILSFAYVYKALGIVSNEEDEFRKCRWSCKNLAIKTKLHDLK